MNDLSKFEFSFLKPNLMAPRDGLLILLDTGIEFPMLEAKWR